jgi:hypothetical protein
MRDAGVAISAGEETLTGIAVPTLAPHAISDGYRGRPFLTSEALQGRIPKV